MRFAYFTHVWQRGQLTPNQRYEQLWRELELIDQLGFDYAFCVEHHFTPTESLNPSPDIFTAFAAARTKRVRLGAMGYVVPLHDPVRLLENVAVLDQMSNGRVEVGLMPGITEHFFKHFSANFADRRQIAAEFARCMRSVYSQGPGANWESEHIKIKDLHLGVWPVQKPNPPMWVATGEAATLQMAAELGMHTGYFLTTPRNRAHKTYGPYLEAWKQHGHPTLPNISFSTLVYIDETDEKAIAKAKDDAGRQYRYFFSYSEDWDEIRKKQGEFVWFFKEKLHDEGMAEMFANLLDPDYLIEKDLLLIGSPETAVEKLRRWSHEGLINTLMGEFAFGEIEEKDLMRSIRLFGEHVIPQLRLHEPF